MSSLADLPADRRAVLELVLVRGSNYDEIARLLSVDRAGVRERALAAFDALGPDTGVAPERRALITDYLLGQLPERVAAEVRGRLATEPGERAWARVIAGELAGVAAAPLPEIPAPNGGAPEPVAEPAPPPAAGAPAAEPAPPRPAPAVARTPRSSRTGGAILLGVGALIVVAIVLVLVLGSGGSKRPRTASTPPATTSRTTSASANPSTNPNVHEIYATKLSPLAPGSKALAGAEVVSASGHPFMFVVAENLAPNSHNYYAVWLLHGPQPAELVGFDRAAVTSNGKLSALAPLHTDYAQYTQIVLTLQPGTAPGTSGPFPTAPGPVILSGQFKVK
jgi:hypothetical protein